MSTLQMEKGNYPDSIERIGCVWWATGKAETKTGSPTSGAAGDMRLMMPNGWLS